MDSDLPDPLTLRGILTGGPTLDEIRGLPPKLTENEIRKRFEAFISNEPYALPVDRYKDNSSLPWPGQYITYKVELAWCVWQEAWSQATGQQSVESQSAKE